MRSTQVSEPIIVKPNRRQRLVRGQALNPANTKGRWYYAFKAGSGSRPRIRSEPFSPIIKAQALVWADTRSGMAEASTTRKPIFIIVQLPGDNLAQTMIKIGCRGLVNTGQIGCRAGRHFRDEKFKQPALLFFR